MKGKEGLQCRRELHIMRDQTWGRAQVAQRRNEGTKETLGVTGSTAMMVKHKGKDVIQSLSAYGILGVNRAQREIRRYPNKHQPMPRDTKRMEYIGDNKFQMTLEKLRGFTHRDTNSIYLGPPQMGGPAIREYKLGTL